MKNPQGGGGVTGGPRSNLAWMSISTNCSKGGDIISVSAWKKRYSAMPQPVFKISLQHCLCSFTGLCRKFQEEGLISIIAFNIFHYQHLILLEHNTKEQFDCEQVENKLFLLIISGFNSLFMVHWIHKKQRWWWERGSTRHLMGGCFIYITLGLAIGKALYNRKNRGRWAMEESD